MEISGRSVDLRALQDGGKVTVAAETQYPMPVNVNVEVPSNKKEVLIPRSEGALINADYLVSADGEIITLTLTNSSGGDLNVVFGSLAAVPSLAPTVGSPFTPYANGNSGVQDQFGASTPQLVGIANRVLFQPIIISQIDFMTDNSALGIQQRAQKINTFTVDFDSDACKNTGAFRMVNDLTNYSTLNKLIPLDAGHGFYFSLLDGVTLEVNLYIKGKGIYNYTA